MIVWKHHVSINFETGRCPCRNNGAGKGATVFTNYDKMLEYLRRDGRRWHVARLRVKKAELEYNFDCDYMATIKVDRYSREGFKPIEL